MLKLFYYKNEYNFGDILNENIIKNLFGIDFEYSSEKKCEMVAIGSLLQVFMTNKFKILKYFSPVVDIWGTGYIKPEEEKYSRLYRRIRVHAVRGYVTLERLRQYTHKKLEHVAIGDPGLLVNRLIDTSNIKKNFDLGIIPHYIDKNNPLLEKIKVDNSIVLDIQQNPTHFLNQIAQCKNVISSAMHGLIAADSLGIPNVRMILSDKIVGGNYKYDDYYSAFGLDSHKKVYLKEQYFTNEDLESISKDYPINAKQVEQICDNLIKTFPYKKK